MKDTTNEAQYEVQFTCNKVLTVTEFEKNPPDDVTFYVSLLLLIHSDRVATST